MNAIKDEVELRENLKQLSEEIRQMDRQTQERPVEKVLAAIQDCRNLIAQSRADGELGKWEEYFLSNAQAAVAADWLMAAIHAIYKAIDFSKMDDGALGTA